MRSVSSRLMQNIYFCKFDTEVFLFAQADSHQFNILCQMPIEPAGENRILSTSIDFELNGYVKYKHSHCLTHVELPLVIDMTLRISIASLFLKFFCIGRNKDPSWQSQLT